MGTNVCRGLSGSQTLQLLIKQNALGIPTTQVRKFAVCPGNGRRDGAACQVLAEGREELSGTAWIPSTSPVHIDATQAVKSPISSLTGGERPQMS